MQNIGGLCALSPTGLSTPDTGGEPGLGPEKREPNLYRERGAGTRRRVRNVKYSAQFHFQQTYNFPACPSAHFLPSLMFKVCKDFPDFHFHQYSV